MATGQALGVLRAWLIGRRDELARLGALVQGERLLDEVLAELDAVAREANGKLLKLSDAASACGYTADHLRTLIKAGKLTDYGQPHAPRVRCDELPLKPGHAVRVLTPVRALAKLKAQIVGNAIPAVARRHNGKPT